MFVLPLPSSLFSSNISTELSLERRRRRKKTFFLYLESFSYSIRSLLSSRLPDQFVVALGSKIERKERKQREEGRSFGTWHLDATHFRPGVHSNGSASFNERPADLKSVVALSLSLVSQALLLFLWQKKRRWNRKRKKSVRTTSLYLVSLEKKKTRRRRSLEAQRRCDFSHDLTGDFSRHALYARLLR